MHAQTVEVIYKDLSYNIVGALYEVYNELGYGHPEKYYYKAIEKEFVKRKISFKSQVYYRILYKGSEVGRYFLDYIAEGKIVLEIKRGQYYSRESIDQIKKYLKATNLKLAILVNLTPLGVKFIRVLNIN